MLILWYFTLLGIYIGPFVSHTHTLSCLRPYSHEFRALNQSSLSDTDIPKWFATKDWNYLLSTLDDAYENLVKEFYANAIVEGE